MKIAIVFINIILLVSINGKLISNGITAELPSFDPMKNFDPIIFLYNDFLPWMVCMGTTLSADQHHDNVMYRLRSLALKFLSCRNKMKKSVESRERLRPSDIHHG